MHDISQVICAREGIEKIYGLIDTVHMRNKPQYFREWRKSKGWSQERLSEELAAVASWPEFQLDPRAENIGKDRSTISKIENGKVPYTQHLLEMLAEVYGTDPGSLIMRNPLDDEPLYSIWDQIPASRRGEAINLLRVLAGSRAA